LGGLSCLFGLLGVTHAEYLACYRV